MYAEMRFGQQQFVPKYMPSKGGEYQYREIEKLAEKVMWCDRFRKSYRGELHQYNSKMYDSENRFIVIMLDGKDMGFVRLSKRPFDVMGVCIEEVWQISDAYIKPPYRGQGVFKNFIDELVANYGVKLILLTAEVYWRNEDYYDDLDFTEIIEIEDGLYRVYLSSFRKEVEARFKDQVLH